MFRRHPGLTLIEVLVVIAILAILIILSIFTWRVQLAKAKDAEKKEDLRRISIAFEDYYNDHDCYPPADTLDICNSEAFKPYLKSIPCNPTTQKTYCYVVDPDSPDCGQNFRVLAPLEYTEDPVIAELGCDSATLCGWEQTCIELTEASGYNYGVSSTNVSIANPDPEPAPSPSPTPSPPSKPKIYYCSSLNNCTTMPNKKTCTPNYNNPFCSNACSNPNNICTPE